MIQKDESMNWFAVNMVTVCPSETTVPSYGIADIIVLKYCDTGITVSFRLTIYVASQNEPEPPKVKFHLLSDCLSKWFIWYVVVHRRHHIFLLICRDCSHTE